MKLPLSQRLLTAELLYGFAAFQRVKSCSWPPSACFLPLHMVLFWYSVYPSMCKTILENSTALNRSLHYGMSANVITFKVKIGWSPQLKVFFEALQVPGTSKVTEAAFSFFFFLQVPFFQILHVIRKYSKSSEFLCRFVCCWSLKIMTGLLRGYSIRHWISCRLLTLINPSMGFELFWESCLICLFVIFRIIY